MSTVETRRYTPNDLLTLPDKDRYELVDGQLVEKAMSAWSSFVGGEVYARLREFCRENKLGWTFSEGTTFQCFPDAPDRVRKADASFFRLDRLSAEEATTEGHLHTAPDLTVEVVSPNDLAYEVDKKVEEWRSAGVEIVWVVHPLNRTIQVFRKDGSGRLVRETDDLEGEALIPGFRCRASELFELPPGVRRSKQ